MENRKTFRLTEAAAAALDKEREKRKERDWRNHTFKYPTENDVVNRMLSDYSKIYELLDHLKRCQDELKDAKQTIRANKETMDQLRKMLFPDLEERFENLEAYLKELTAKPPGPGPDPEPVPAGPDSKTAGTGRPGSKKKTASEPETDQAKSVSELIPKDKSAADLVQDFTELIPVLENLAYDFRELQEITVHFSQAGTDAVQKKTVNGANFPDLNLSQFLQDGMVLKALDLQFKPEPTGPTKADTVRVPFRNNRVDFSKWTD